VSGTAAFSLANSGSLSSYGVPIGVLDGGGRIQSDKGDMGFAAGSSGTVNVTSGSWANTQAIFVGVSGSGTLNVGGQGVISRASAPILRTAPLRARPTLRDPQPRRPRRQSPLRAAGTSGGPPPGKRPADMPRKAAATPIQSLARTTPHAPDELPAIDIHSL
jgi:T5SS/PEP-CTERM-associated repeat protein